MYCSDAVDEPKTSHHSCCRGIFLGCGGSKDSDEAVDTAKEKSPNPSCLYPFLPINSFFEKIAGDLIDIKVIVGEGDDPHSYSPTPKQIVDMAKAISYVQENLDLKVIILLSSAMGRMAPRIKPS